MTRPAKKRGFRQITINDKAYRWKLYPGADESTLKVATAEEGGQVLIVQLSDWRDPWLNISGFHMENTALVLHTDAQNEPAIISPKFVHSAILYALAQGWTPKSIQADPLHIRYQDQKFIKIYTNPK